MLYEVMMPYEEGKESGEKNRDVWLQKTPINQKKGYDSISVGFE